MLVTEMFGSAYYGGNSIFHGDSFMRKNNDISIVINYPEGEISLKELENRKANILIDILNDKYGEKLVKGYVGSIREKMGKYS
jgi:hypothetical protein